jgi:hypothetical protein
LIWWLCLFNQLNIQPVSLLWTRFDTDGWPNQRLKKWLSWFQYLFRFNIFSSVVMHLIWPLNWLSLNWSNNRMRNIWLDGGSLPFFS